MNIEDVKKQAGVYAADLIQQGMVIGLGTGSTVYWLIQELAHRVQQGLQVNIVPTSKHTKQLATELNIPQVELNAIEKLVLTIDGADEIDGSLQLIKGGGGALLQEKIVAAASEQFIVIADSTKLVERLGKFPLPVEVIGFGYRQVQNRVWEMGCSKVVLREKNDEIFVTDHGHYILDCYFETIDNAADLNAALHQIPGVVETGLFVNMATKAIIAFADGTVKTIL